MFIQVYSIWSKGERGVPNGFLGTHISDLDNSAYHSQWVAEKSTHQLWYCVSIHYPNRNSKIFTISANSTVLTSLALNRLCSYLQYSTVHWNCQICQSCRNLQQLQEINMFDGNLELETMLSSQSNHDR
jgi:hypothetical protein